MSTSAAFCECSRFVPVTEAAALAAAQWTGRGDGLAADAAAREAMAAALADMPFRVRVVATRGGDSVSRVLGLADEVGGGSGRECSEGAGAAGSIESSYPLDIAVDALQACNALAAGKDGALAIVAAGPPGSLMAVPEMYMQKLVVPAGAASAIDPDAPAAENVRAVASALGRRPENLVVMVLDRPRHEGLVDEIRGAGARVRLIGDGDVSAGVAVASEDVGVDMYMGIGGSTEGILTAAALRCLGGEIQARFWPVSRRQVEMIKAAGVEDIEVSLSTRDMAGDEVLFSATAVTGGRLLKGVDHAPDGTRTETLVLCSRCHAVRKIRTVHRSGNGGPPVRLGAR